MGPQDTNAPATVEGEYSDEIQSLVVTDIAALESKNLLNQDDEDVWALTIRMRKGCSPNCALLAFDSRDNRDGHCAVLKYLCDRAAPASAHEAAALPPPSAASAASPPSGPSRQEVHATPGLATIARIDLAAPSRTGPRIATGAPKVLIHCSVVLNHKQEPVTIEVPEGRTGSEDCRRIVRAFIAEHQVLPSESKSLYRFLRSVTQRALMQRETTAVIAEIDAQRLGAEVGAAGTSRSAFAAELGLKRLAAEIPERLGQNGVCAGLVAQILSRNIEKTRLINKLAANVQTAAFAESSLSSEPSGHHAH